MAVLFDIQNSILEADNESIAVAVLSNEAAIAMAQADAIETESQMIAVKQ